MVFDFIVLCLATWSLLQMPGRTSLWKLIFMDGLSYFIVAFACYLACAVAAFSNAGIFITWVFILPSIYKVLSSLSVADSFSGTSRQRCMCHTRSPHPISLLLELYYPHAE